ncbi:MAG: YdeI/OmpD-associated family protein [Phreatobacter sp.]|uniref:YdeI/OmpD-associated family protein n=1 Tax=Phreatobacter sp. TaxID=1966341 RepID=UPI001A4C4D40|nr:YdeI/OmpD-associated family protein [Phreatobacter sp.]MBL8570031.1 YdeI/OmpD-associated family protein [Phreatobacter sp.]
MPPVLVDPDKVHAFEDADAFHLWLSRNHASQTEVWIRIHKVASGLRSITPAEAIDICLCWGWIDAIRKSLDATSYLQRYTPRGRKSVWSEINVANVARLTAEGRMTEHGLRHVEAARADGRWDRAYRVRDAKVPDDLRAAIDANPTAKAMFATLSAQNRFALVFRIQGLKTEAGRRKRIAAFVDMLARGETIHPQRGQAQP